VESTETILERLNHVCRREPSGEMMALLEILSGVPIGPSQMSGWLMRTRHTTPRMRRNKRVKLFRFKQGRKRWGLVFISKNLIEKGNMTIMSGGGAGIVEIEDGAVIYRDVPETPSRSRELQHACLSTAKRRLSGAGIGGRCSSGVIRRQWGGSPQSSVDRSTYRTLDENKSRMRKKGS